MRMTAFIAFALSAGLVCSSAEAMPALQPPALQSPALQPPALQSPALQSPALQSKVLNPLIQPVDYTCGDGQHFTNQGCVADAKPAVAAKEKAKSKARPHAQRKAKPKPHAQRKARPKPHSKHVKLLHHTHR